MIENLTTAIDWQSVVTLGIVFAALIVLARRACGLFTSKSTSGCGGCSGCPASASKAAGLVQLELGPSGSRSQ